MLSVSTLIDFLMGLLRDDQARAAFELNPQAELDRHGLDGVSGQDIRDARLVMADNGGVRPTGDHRPSSGHDDPVREIHHTTRNYELDDNHQHHPAGDIDQTFNLVTIDDRDTVIVDSFNSNDNNDVDVVAVQDNSTETNTENDIDIDLDGPDSTDEPTDADPDADPADDAGPVDDVPPENGPVDDVPVGSGPVEDGPFGEEPIVDLDPVDELPTDEPFDTEPADTVEPVELDHQPELDAAIA